MKTVKELLSEAKPDTWTKQADKMNKDLSKLFGKGLGVVEDETSSDIIRVTFKNNMLPPVWSVDNIPKLNALLKKYKAMLAVTTRGEFMFAFSK